MFKLELKKAKEEQEEKECQEWPNEATRTANEKVNSPKGQTKNTSNKVRNNASIEKSSHEKTGIRVETEKSRSPKEKNKSYSDMVKLSILETRTPTKDYKIVSTPSKQSTPEPSYVPISDNGSSGKVTESDDSTCDVADHDSLVTIHNSFFLDIN